MKNTLLAVLVTSLCNSGIQAQRIAPHSPGYAKYREGIPNQSIDKGTRKVNPLRDGVAGTNQFTNKNAVHTKMADGVASSDKLADILLNSLENFDSVGKAGKPAMRQMSAAGYTYAGYMKQLVSKPRPQAPKKSGWLL